MTHTEAVRDLNAAVSACKDAWVELNAANPTVRVAAWAKFLKRRTGVRKARAALVAAEKTRRAYPKDACKQCGAALKPGKAIEQTWVGTPDFGGDQNPVTMSVGGSGRLVDCLKCEKCGMSVTLGEQT